MFQLPPKPADQGHTPPSSAPAGAYNPYSPPVVPAQHASAPAAPVNIGFENLSSTSLHFIYYFASALIASQSSQLGYGFHSPGKLLLNFWNFMLDLEFLVLSVDLCWF